RAGRLRRWRRRRRRPTRPLLRIQRRSGRAGTLVTARHREPPFRRLPPRGECMTLRMRVYEREPIGLALRRFKKLLERSGIIKELRKRKYYEKPCEARRRAELRKQSAIRKAKTAVRKP